MTNYRQIPWCLVPCETTWLLVVFKMGTRVYFAKSSFGKLPIIDHKNLSAGHDKKLKWKNPEAVKNVDSKVRRSTIYAPYNHGRWDTQFVIIEFGRLAFCKHMSGADKEPNRGAQWHINEQQSKIQKCRPETICPKPRLIQMWPIVVPCDKKQPYLTGCQAGF